VSVFENPSFSCSFSRHAKTHASMVLVIWLNENVHFYARFLAMPKLMQAWFWSFGLTKTFISCSFSRHAKTLASMVLVIWLNENVHIHVRFLAMPKLMQAWFWSSGLTKTLFYKFCRDDF